VILKHTHRSGRLQFIESPFVFCTKHITSYPFIRSARVHIDCAPSRLLLNIPTTPGPNRISKKPNRGLIYATVYQNVRPCTSHFQRSNSTGTTTSFRIRIRLRFSGSFKRKAKHQHLLKWYKHKETSCDRTTSQLEREITFTSRRGRRG